jgi:hypothetical protein
MTKFNIYCDESCHLENDGQSIMILGYIKVNDEEGEDLRHKFKYLQRIHRSPTELKWNTVSASRMPYYRSLIDAFFEFNHISFRCILVSNKHDLDHQQFNDGDHDSFYYKLVYLLLNNRWLTPNIHNGHKREYRVFLDIKDTRGRERLAKIKQVFANQHYSESPFLGFQHLHSHDSFWIQLADFFIGAVGYKARGEHLQPNASATKKEIINYLEYKSGYLLDQPTSPFEHKFNIFNFQVRKSNSGNNHA